QPIRDSAGGQPIAVDGLDCLLNHTAGIDGVRPKKGRLGAELAAARSATMDAHLDSQDDRLLEINVDRDTGHIPHTRRWVATLGAGEGRMAPAHLPNRAWHRQDSWATGIHGRRPSSGHNLAGA